MENIIVVECSSTGVHYIQDIIDRNYNPIALQTKIGTSEEEKLYARFRQEALDLIDADYETVYEKETYEETLEMVREYNPKVIVIGSERGVALGTRLANDLNLKCNPIENIEAITLKDKMQERLAEKGLRHIRGHRVKTVEEAINFYDESKLTDVVVKPIFSAGTVGVKLCSNRAELADAVETILNEANFFGDEINELVVQEYINGEEYVINTIACDGDYRVTTMWKYIKVKTPEGDYIYDYTEIIDELDVGDASIIEYAFEVNNALGIKYGPVHGEFMVDEKGPVLIEVNCRPMGIAAKPDYLNRISGQHETDSALDSYINPEKFQYQKIQRYQIYEHGIIKSFIVPKDLVARSNPIKYINENLESHYVTNQDITANPKFIKTKDLETSGGEVYLVNKDLQVIHKDLDFLRFIERYAFDLVLSDETNEEITYNENETSKNLEQVLDTLPEYGSVLLLSDKTYKRNSVFQISADEINDLKSNFDCIIVDLVKTFINHKAEDRVLQILKIIPHLKNGGIIFIPPSTYKYLPNGRIGAESLLKSANLKLELPMTNLAGFIIATRR